MNFQDIKKCSPEGRDCIENSSTCTFNCSVTCEGIYADVGWVDEMGENLVEDEEEISLTGHFGEELKKTRVMYKNLKKEIEMMKGSISKRGDERDRRKYMKLVSEYQQFKKNEVQHFRFNSAVHATTFGKLIPILFFDANQIQNE